MVFNPQSPRPGVLRYEKQGLPQLGQPLQVKIDGGSWVAPITLYARAATSATPGNRYPRISVFDADGNTMQEYASPIAITAGQTVPITARNGSDFVVQATDKTQVLTFLAPPLPSGTVLQLSLDGVDVSDALTNPYFVYVEYVEGSEDYSGFPVYGGIPIV